MLPPLCTQVEEGVDEEAMAGCAAPSCLLDAVPRANSSGHAGGGGGAAGDIGGVRASPCGSFKKSILKNGGSSDGTKSPDGSSFTRGKRNSHIDVLSGLLPTWAVPHRWTRESATAEEEVAVSADPFKQVLHHSPYIHPTSLFMKLWDLLTLFLASFYLMISVPIRIAFPTLWPSTALIAADALASCLLLADTVLRFYVAYEDTQMDADDLKTGAALFSSTSQDAHLVVDRSRIIRRHLRGHFWIGLAAGLPIDLFVLAITGSEWASGSTQPAVADTTDISSYCELEAGPAAYCSLLRLAAMFHLSHFFESWEWNSVEVAVADRLLKNLMVGATGAHWLACGFILVGRLSEKAGRSSHLSALTELDFYHQVGSAGPEVQYVRALYWALTTMSGVGFGDVHPGTYMRRLNPRFLLLCLVTVCHALYPHVTQFPSARPSTRLSQWSSARPSSYSP